MPRAVQRRDVVIYRDPAAYVSHPCIARLDNGDLLVAFNESLPRRPYLHPPSDPRFVNLMARSRDGGLTWKTPRVVPGYGWTGVECPGITQITSGEVLLNQWRFEWVPLETARALAERPGGPNFLVADPSTRSWRTPVGDDDWSRSALPWARSDDGCYVSISQDRGATWTQTVRVVTDPYPRGYSPRPVVELTDGTLLLALGSHEEDLSTIYVVRSEDRGRTWGLPIPVIGPMPGRHFGEPSALALSDGQVILMIREEFGHQLLAVESEDGGQTWSEAWDTGIWGYPAHLVALGSGAILCVYGHRRPPFGIRCCTSADGGRIWSYGDELVIRDDLPNANLGYPTAVELDDGEILVAYYGEDGDGVTFVMGSFIRL